MSAAELRAEVARLTWMLDEAARLVVSLRGAYMPRASVLADLARRWGEQHDA